MNKILFVVGMPRCGTTNLCNLLSQHPEINAGRLKEPGFFLFSVKNKLYAYNSSGKKIDFSRLGYLQTERDYVKNYSSSKEDIWLDGTTIYSLHIESFIESVRGSDLLSHVEKKFIVLYRDKAKRAVSHYLFSLSRGEEFRKFDCALEDEISGRDEDWLLGGYIKGGEYENVVELIAENFGKDSVKAYDIDRFNASYEKSLDEIVSFVGAKDFLFNMEVYKNSNFSSTSPLFNFLRRLIKKIRDFNPRFFENKLFRKMFEMFVILFGENQNVYKKKAACLLKVYENYVKVKHDI